MKFVHKKERILISKIYTANIKLILAFRVSGFLDISEAKAED